VLAAALALAGCSQSSTEEPEVPEAPGALVASDKERITQPGVTAEDLTALASANTDFGVALYRQVAKPGENLFFSPFSISQGFSMVYPGARGNTELQMQQALRFTLPQDKLHPAMNALDLALQRPIAPQPGQQGTPPELRVVNASWGQEGYTFEPAYLDTLAQHYGAGMRAVDFKNDPEAIRGQINDWVAAMTNERIKDLLPERTVKPDTRLMLVNALYFKGAWAFPFNPSGTRSESFHLLDGTTSQVNMMERRMVVPYKRAADFQAFALPYVGNSIQMLLVMPDEGRFQDVEARLSASFLDTVHQGMQSTDMYLNFPKFQVETTIDLPPAMQALGMTDAFSERADLSGITTSEQLFLGVAKHKAFLAVDEKGTEAAAATAIGAEPVSLPPTFTVDRPFLLLIEDTETKTVLFLGRVMKP
jgi:serpin B